MKFGSTQIENWFDLIDKLIFKHIVILLILKVIAGRIWPPDLEFDTCGLQHNIPPKQ